MILTTTLPLLSVLLTAATYVHASKCGASYDNICLDGTDSTPCCGYGKCNVFCYNCNGGCRRENYEGCTLKSASDFYKCQTTGGFGNIFQICETVRDGADAECRKKYPGHSKRSVARDTAATADTVNDTATAAANTSDAIFDFADADSSGNMTLQEYFTIMNVSMGDSAPEISHRSTWAKYFLSFDADGDGVLSVGEHYAAIVPNTTST